jgi:6-phosphogluconolactonase
MDIAKQGRGIAVEKNTFTHERDGILITPVNDTGEGLAIAAAIIYGIVDRKTTLYLSGGSTPKPLYEQFAKEEILTPGVVAMIDERYGDPLHEKSNEKTIIQTGIVRYLSIRDIPFYAMLRGTPIAETADRYDELIRSLQTVYPKNVGVLGIGSDGHTAGIAPNRHDFKNPLFAANDYAMVSHFDDPTGPFKKRVTMTFLGLTMLDLNIVLVFGKEKEQGLQLLFDEGTEQDIPARFYKRPDIAPRTIIITDCQSV